MGNCPGTSKVKTILAEVSLVLVLSTACFGQTAECNHGMSPCEAYANSDAVFVAKVIKISPETINIWQRDKDYDQTANVVVEKIYKGIKRNRLTLHQLGSKNAPKFILGSRYLFYANFDRVTNKWEVKSCGRTHLANYVQDDLNYLKGLPASLNKTRIAGQVTLYETDNENPQGTTERLAGIKIRIKGEGREYEVVADANGIYELYDAPPGRYVVEPDIPRGLKLMGVMHYGPFDRSKFRSLIVELKERGCSAAGLILTPEPATENRKIGKH
jgi:hypothetical protein